MDDIRCLFWVICAGFMLFTAVSLGMSQKKVFFYGWVIKALQGQQCFKITKGFFSKCPSITPPPLLWPLKKKLFAASLAYPLIPQIREGTHKKSVVIQNHIFFF